MDVPIEILVVDHPAEDAERIVEILERRGFRALACSDGFDALQLLFSTGRYAGVGQAPDLDLAFLSLDMPWPDGPELLRRIRASRRLRALPVVFLDGTRGPRGGSAHPPAHPIISKPVREDDVVAVLTSFGIGAR